MDEVSRGIIITPRSFAISEIFTMPQRGQWHRLQSVLPVELLGSLLESGWLEITDGVLATALA